MNAWTRWQDWATMLLGVIAIGTPFVFGIDPVSAGAWTAYVMGALLILAGMWSASMDEPNAGVEWLPLVIGAMLFVAPWLLPLTATSPMAWMAWIIGGIAVVNSVSELLLVRPTATA